MSSIISLHFPFSDLSDLLNGKGVWHASSWSAAFLNDETVCLCKLRPWQYLDNQQHKRPSNVPLKLMFGNHGVYHVYMHRHLKMVTEFDVLQRRMCNYLNVGMLPNVLIWVWPSNALFLRKFTFFLLLDTQLPYCQRYDIEFMEIFVVYQTLLNTAQWINITLCWVCKLNVSVSLSVSLFLKFIFMKQFQ